MGEFLYWQTSTRLNKLGNRTKLNFYIVSLNPTEWKCKQIYRKLPKGEKWDETNLKKKSWCVSQQLLSLGTLQQHTSLWRNTGDPVKNKEMKRNYLRHRLNKQLYQNSLPVKMNICFFFFVLFSFFSFFHVSHGYLICIFPELINNIMVVYVFVNKISNYIHILKCCFSPLDLYKINVNVTQWNILVQPN